MADHVTESVWDYPRPPALSPTQDAVVVRFGGGVVASSTRSVRVLETSHPPVYYLPRDDVAAGALEPADGTSWCEFKGLARYLTVVGADGRRARHAAWEYPEPSAGYEPLAGHVAFYPGLMDECTVDGDPVTPQEGDFYGGWVTPWITGPFKGPPGTLGW